MNYPRRPHHRKRFSVVRLSSDSPVGSLPAYTSPTWKAPVLPGETSDRPPDYPDSAEEADADTESDGDESNVLYIPSPPQGSTPSTTRRSPAKKSARRHHTVPSSDSYLDSLLERSVHALEMSNVLLQSSMSTQTSLTSMFADDFSAERTLEARARMLSSRIHNNRDLHDNWMGDLEQISEGVGRLAQKSSADQDDIQNDFPVSMSLPTSGFVDHARRRTQPSRRASMDFQNTSGSHLSYSNHDRSHFIAPAPRALTMYVDSDDHPDMITLPATLGVRPATELPPTPLLTDLSSPQSPPPPPPPDSAEQSSKALGILSIYGGHRNSFHRSTSSLGSLKSRSARSGRSTSTSSSMTMRKPRRSRSPPPPLIVDTSSTPSGSPSKFNSRSTTPHRSGSPSRHPYPMTPPIEELSASSSSSSSGAFHVEQTVHSLRQILDKQRITSSASSPDTSKAPLPLPSPRPPQRLLNPPSSPPILGTSNATASVSRLFTKARHTTSTRPPSPPRQSALKVRSTPSTPVTPIASAPSPAHSMLNIPDALGVITRRRSATSSGASTPKRISFAELPESYSRSKPEGASSRFKTRSHSKTRDKGKGVAGPGGGGSGSKGKDDDGLAWWAKWFLGPTGEFGSGDRYEERIARGASWGARPGLANGMEDWGA